MHDPKNNPRPDHHDTFMDSPFFAMSRRRPRNHQHPQSRSSGGARPRFPVDRELMRELREMFLLQALADTPEGLTGYQLEKQYKVPRTTVINTMDGFEKVGLVTVQSDGNDAEQHEDGRTRKYFKISDTGLARLEELKEKLASVFYLLMEMAPIEHHSNPFAGKRPLYRLLKGIDSLQSKQEAMDMFGGMRYRVSKFKRRLERRLDRVEKTQGAITTLIEEIEKMDTLDVERIKEMVKDARLESLGPENTENESRAENTEGSSE